VSRNIAGETVVVPICRGVGDLDSIFTFNTVGTHLWNLLATEHTEFELTKSVTEEFEVSEEVAQSDVRNFMADLLEVGLVRTV
jgi:Coenzyme PQQ synthesis protein D (PqqD)